MRENRPRTLHQDKTGTYETRNQSLAPDSQKNVLVEAGLHDELNTGKDSRDQFIKRHADTLWQCDYLTKPMWTAKGVINLFIIVFIHIGTLQIWISPATASPNTTWTSQ